MSYAADTKVPIERSKAELDKLVAKYGASGFGSYSEDTRAMVVFQVRGRRVMFILDLPPATADQFKRRKVGKYSWDWRTPEGARAAWEQACRSKWRALVLVVKAKLEAIEAGVSTFEDEFLPHFVMPDGRRVRDAVLPALDDVLSKGTLPPLLPAPATGGGA